MSICVFPHTLMHMAPDRFGWIRTRITVLPRARAHTHTPHRVLAVADCWANRVRLIAPAGFELGSLGSGEEGHADGPMEEANVNGPHGLCKDLYGNLYVADAYNHALRRLSDLCFMVTRTNTHVHKSAKACVGDQYTRVR